MAELETHDQYGEKKASMRGLFVTVFRDVVS